MTTHLTLNGELRSETDAEAVANLLRKGWVQTTKPGDDYDWQGGAWVQRPAPVAEAVTADEWVDAQGYEGKKPTTLLYLKLQLEAAAAVSPKLAAVQAWLDSMIVAGIQDFHARRNDWPAAPYSFAEASGEALAVLQAAAEGGGQP